jgi:signal transduction histidine kinase
LCWTYTGDLFEEAAGAVREIASARGILLEVEDGDCLVVCDRARIVQVLINLLENAVKFTPAGGTVTLAAASVEDRVRIRVSDTGRGIADADLPRLFERYWRNSGGTGIGLATARALVAAHDSDLRVTSTVGSGSTFFFDLHSAD